MSSISSKNSGCYSSAVPIHERPLVPFLQPSTQCETFYINIVSLLPPAVTHKCTYSSPVRYILTCIDSTTRWIETMPMQDNSATTVTMFFLNIWIFHFGVYIFIGTV